ncbi:hypothetical protein PYCC9005_004716 [Savitreella phatthalungensis]
MSLRALVTGASGGIGQAICIAFASRGYELVLQYSSHDPTLLRETLAKEYAHIRVLFVQVDLSEQIGCETLAKEALDFFDGRCDIFVSNAGAALMKAEIWDIGVSDLDSLHAINVRPSFMLCKAVVPGMKERGFGRLIFISSISALGGGVNGCHYAASKGAMTSMMRNLSAHLAKFGITANDVSPALIEDTGMIPSDRDIPIKRDMIPVGRLGKPNEVARVVEMLVDVGYMTGQSLLLSGGLK